MHSTPFLPYSKKPSQATQAGVGTEGDSLAKAIQMGQQSLAEGRCVVTI